MMNTVTLYSYLKNSDLDCLSAFEAIKSVMKYEKLSSLRRFRVIEIVHPSSDKQLAIKEVETIINTTYFLLNQNKEGVFVNHLPNRKLKENQKVSLIKVASKESEDMSDTIKKIQQKSQIKIDTINESMLWELTVNDSEKNQIELEKEIEEKIVTTSSIQKGLLCNPIFQTSEFVSKQVAYA